MTLRRVGVVGSVGAAYHIPSASQADWAPLSLVAGIISQSPNGRLYKALVESKLATSAQARADNAHDPGLFFASASCEPDKLDMPCVTTLVKTIESLGDKPFTEDEVNKAKARSKRAAEMLQSNAQQMSQVLSSASALGRLAADVHPARPGGRHDRGRCQPRDSRPISGRIQPDGRRLHPVARRLSRSEVPAAPPIDVVVKDYKGGSVGAEGEAFDPSPANLDARDQGHQ